MALWPDPEHLLVQLGLLLLAFILTGLIGIERERRLKSAGLRTHILVGLGAALFTLVSAYGFTALGLGPTDPSRIAAQVVTGIGFVGAGVIFVNRGNVVGLTTAASIWVTAAVGMACGAGLPVLAVAGTVLHLLAVGSLPMAERMLRRTTGVTLTVRVLRGGTAVRDVLDRCAASSTKTRIDELREAPDGAALEFSIRVRGRRPEANRLVADLAEIVGVTGITALDDRAV
ncbi:MgtC/SapB family protein [Leifsonia sp. F6_8S_P_1B]|uniref:MgtC/SapB family protein n=1 Tax=Leifsonia williamsii TaxID=3035919 RepID=A0ABT8KE77_9MICO|nr:MgtC/SapB family protein [Leifsonia williamsii]MDN4615773.1 MgtC/SapB family protein [Leifsonia williamsii]